MNKELLTELKKLNIDSDTALEINNDWLFKEYAELGVATILVIGLLAVLFYMIKVMSDE